MLFLTKFSRSSTRNFKKVGVISINFYLALQKSISWKKVHGFYWLACFCCYYLRAQNFWNSGLWPKSKQVFILLSFTESQFLQNREWGLLTHLLLRRLFEGSIIRKLCFWQNNSFEYQQFEKVIPLLGETLCVT